jgi:hypothetical protein
MTISVAVLSAWRFDREKEIEAARFSQSQRQRQPIPTYTIEINADRNDFPVSIEGKYQKPDGEVVPITMKSAPLPIKIFVNADCLVELKISTTQRPFGVTVFYEHEETTRWLASGKGTPDVPVTLELKPYSESQ